MGDEEDGKESCKYIANFLFGNIDGSGELENDDILDNESRRSLASFESLHSLGLHTIINEILDETVDKGNRNKAGESSHADENMNGEVSTKHDHKQEGSDEEREYDIKSPSAIDYSDINELAEEFLEQAVIKREDDTTDYDADDEGPGCKNDSQLMPPPPPLNDIDSKESLDEENRKRKLETPLAAMLPSKYADVDVRELFPDFRVDKVCFINFSSEYSKPQLT